MNDLMREKMAQGREYRKMAEFRSIEEDMVVEGYATTFDEDYLLYSIENYRFYERVDRHAFDNCDMSDVILQYDHEGRVYARTSNNTLELSCDDHGLKVRANLGGTEIGKELYNEIKGGYTTKMSFGFKVEEDEERYVNDKENGIYSVYRTIKKISKLYDVSAVSLPANDTTEISARCVGEGVIADAKKEFLAVEERANKIKKLKLRLELES